MSALRRSFFSALKITPSSGLLFRSWENARIISRQLRNLPAVGHIRRQRRLIEFASETMTGVNGMGNRSGSKAVSNCRHGPDTMRRPFLLPPFDLAIKPLVGKPRRYHDDCIGFHMGLTACVNAGELHVILLYGPEAMGQLENRA